MRRRILHSPFSIFNSYVVVRMPRPGVQNWAWYLGSPTDDAVALSGCAVDARGATAACGVWAVSSGPILVENCSFLNFPFGGDTRFEYGVGIGLDATARQMPTNTTVRVTGTLFDVSFTNGWALARVGEATNEGAYAVSFSHALLPAAFPSAATRRPETTEGLLFGEAGVAATGQLTNEQALAVGACPQPGFSHIDLNGLVRTATTDIGAFAYAPVPTSSTDDTDGDGISDADEFAWGLDPFSDDTDCDGVSDADEIVQGTDPADIRSFLRTILVTVVNADMIENATNYVAWGMTPDWTADDIHDVLAATGEGGGDAFEGFDSAEALFVKAFRDLDRDGVCDSAREPVIVCEVGRWSVSPSFRFAFGDVDGDGVSDAAEFADGTNPNDALNFRFAATLAVANVDATASITNHLAWGAAAGDIAEEATFTGTRFERSVSVVVTNGHLLVSCWRDLDKDGIYTPGEDVRRTWTFTKSNNGRVSLTIGDADGDGIPDGVECVEGTDWNASTNYCCNISVTYTDIFQTTNALTFVACWGDTEVSAPAVVTAKTWTHDFGHRVATHGERAGVHVWDDANHNGVWDEGETGDKYDFKPSGHTTCITNELAYGHFDRNGNNLPDWWEAETQLSADGRSVKEYEDTDGDGLINLHEFWAGTNPLVSDGSNTLLSVCSRGVDDRIRDIADPSAAVSRFINFETNGRNGLFVTNANFWARDLDFGCVSVWHDNPPDGSGEKSATAVTRRHVVLANHWSDSSYIFFDTNGVDYIRTIVSSIRIPGTDLRLGRLNEDLPDSISVPKVLPANFSRYVGKGKYLPIVCLTHKKTASVAELATLDCSQRCSDDNITYNQLAKTEETNYVSSVRKQIRAATVDGLSGSPVFLVVDNQLVFLFSKHMGYRDRATWAPNWGPMISYHLDTIQSVINNWEGSNASRYQLNILSSADFDVIVTERSGGTQ